MNSGECKGGAKAKRGAERSHGAYGGADGVPGRTDHQS